MFSSSHNGKTPKYFYKLVILVLSCMFGFHYTLVQVYMVTSVYVYVHMLWCLDSRQVISPTVRLGTAVYCKTTAGHCSTLSSTALGTVHHVQ